MSYIVNHKLMNAIDGDGLVKLGFEQQNDGSGDPRGIDWVYDASAFYIHIDPWFEVSLNRKDVNCDGITLHVDDVDELKEAMEFIQPAGIYSEFDSNSVMPKLIEE